MSQEKRQMEAALASRRIYEYTGSDGATYYSFTKKDSKLSPSIRLTIKSRIGIHFLNFLTKIRQTAKKFDVEEG